LRGSKVSKRYAKALLSLGREDGNYGAYGENLQEFRNFCDQNGEFADVITNRVFSLEDRREILQAVLEKTDFPVTMRNFLYLLLDKNRIGAIQEIAEHYASLTDEISNIARAEIVATRPLKSDEQARLEKVLGDLTSKNVRVEFREDKSLIGGVIVKIRDLVLDGSIRAQLEGLKESLKRGDYN
jgi:F-type H+-transporting ATPase subunit delta